MNFRMLSLAFATLIAAASMSAQAKTFVYCSEGSPSSFDPQTITDGTSIDAAAHTIYSRLLEFELGTTKVNPSLAESWKISMDKTVYTFKLRKGVKFHTTPWFTPTRDFNADDVVFTFERQWKKENAFNSVGGGTYEYFDGMEMGKVLKSVKALDPYTVEVTLNNPEAPFTANLAMSFMSILSKEYADKLAATGKKDQIGVQPVGTGPFVFQSYQKDNTIKFAAFDKFWGKHGNIDKLVFSITPDASVRYQKLKTGECNMANEPSPADVPDMKKNDKLTVMQAPGLNVGYLAMNTAKKPFDNLNVRKAIHHALNRRSYIDAIYMGNATVAKNPIPSTIWSYNDAVKDYDYDVKKAKELLKKAGYPNGFETEMWTLPVSRPYNPNGKKMGELMQSDLEKVGIKVKLTTFDWPTYLQRVKGNEHQMVQMGWTGDNGDPDNFLYSLLSCSAIEAGSNYARWCYKPFNDLISDAKKQSEIKKRTELYKKAQLVFKEQAPWVTIAHSTVFKVMTKNVKGFKVDPFGGNIFREVNVE